MKQKAVSLLRRLRLLEQADRLKYLVSALRNRRDNRHFRQNNPDVPLPPPFILYESFGKLSYRSYYVNGRESAQYIIDSLKRHTSLENARLCEWGCGPARLIRHFPELLKGCNTELHGSDYNTRTIDWCGKNLPMITFSTNVLNPPLPYADGYFDVLYCVSVFTHLSPDNQERWLRECLRVLKSGGIFFLTVHGDTCTAGLSDSERKGYSIEGCVVRDGVTEGQRTYTSYNRPSFMRNVLLKDLEIAEYIAGTDGAQDIWIVRK